MKTKGNYRHGAAFNGKMTPEYRTWLGIRNRCNNPNEPMYPHYGGKGIRVCKEWDDFAVFLADMGKRPIGLSIERNDSSEDYCATNCRWATPTEQVRNRTITVKYEIDGVTKPLAEWAEIHGVFYKLAWERLKRGHTLQDALTPGKRKTGVKPKQKEI